MKIKITLLLFLASLRREKELPANAAIEIMIYAGFHFPLSVIVRLPSLHSLSKTHLTHLLSPTKINLQELNLSNLSNPIKPINVIKSDTFLPHMQRIISRQEENAMPSPLSRFLVAASQSKKVIKPIEHEEIPYPGYITEIILSHPQVNHFISRKQTYGEKKFIVAFLLKMCTVSGGRQVFTQSEELKLIMDYSSEKKATFVFQPPLVGRVTHATVDLSNESTTVTHTAMFKP